MGIILFKITSSHVRTPEGRYCQAGYLNGSFQKRGVVIDTWILDPKNLPSIQKKVSKSIHEYPKVSIFVSFFVDQSHPLNQLSTSSLEF